MSREAGKPAEPKQATRTSPFHAGELAVQERMGVRESIGPWAGKVVRPFLPDQHRDFYGALPFLVAAARDEGGRPWATLLTGEPGFAQSPDPRTLHLAVTPPRGDALHGALRAGSPLGLLGIELATRRRNRVNGRIVGRDEGGLTLAVDQSFGNCPQYIRERAWQRIGNATAPPPPVRSPRLTPPMRQLIEAADTFFIASGAPAEHGEAMEHDPALGMDASHRGGPPGFVRLESDRRLVFPDYAGNDHYNTIGNLVVDPRVGLLFLDWASGALLQLTGRATIDWDSPALEEHPGARRLVVIELDEAVLLPEAHPLRWDASGEAVRSLRLVDRIRESDDVVSFVLEARDGGALPGFSAGQHLPIELDVPGAAGPVRRTYSLSSGPDEPRYRISVKREPRGTASRHLHDALDPGAIVAARAPAGEFVLEHGTRPVALVSAGIGVTPMVSMLKALAAAGDRRPVVFVHVARDGRHHPLADEVRREIERADSASLHVFYSRPRAQDAIDREFDHAGRPEPGQLLDLVAEATGGTGERTDVDVYLCGPVPFMAAMQEGLEAQGVASERIHGERFGPRG